MGSDRPRYRNGPDPWLRPDLRDPKYGDVGDAYDDKLYRSIGAKWRDKINFDGFPYSRWVRDLAENGYIHLRFLSDFLTIGTVPQRWKDLDPEQVPQGKPAAERVSRREERFAKTKVAVLEYHDDKVELKGIIENAQNLRDELDSGVSDDVRFRLFVVEDLSRDVIESLGQKLKIDPDFFRASIADFAWFNVLDRWRDPPSLQIASRTHDWMQLRYVTLRYFDKRDDFDEAFDESTQFNIYRRPDDDRSNKSFWDRPEAIVGLTRSRATYWLQPEPNQQNPGARVGVLLLDPTVTKGKPLWRGRRTCWPTPQYPDTYAESPPIQGSVFDDFIFWARQKDMFQHPSAKTDPPSRAQAPMRVLLHLTCAEWLTMIDYIRTRLSQLELEILNPGFVRGSSQIDGALDRLHMWRRLVPLYLEMIRKTLEHLRPPSHKADKTIVVPSDQATTFTVGTPSARRRSHGVMDEMRPEANTPTSPAAATTATTGASRGAGSFQPTASISDYHADFVLIKQQLEDDQERIDRLTQVVTAVMAIDDSRRSLQDNHNIGRLTWLATFTIPFTLIAGVLSMQSDVSAISSFTFRIYFGTALPLAFIVTVGALTLSGSTAFKHVGLVRNFLRNVIRYITKHLKR